MPNPQLTPPQGPFLSFLDWLDRPGQAVMNSLQGKWGSAGRQALDFLGEIPDAVLPGNMIPDATTPEDQTTASETLGLSPDTSPWLRVPVDIVGGTLANPLSFVGGAPAKLLGAGAKTALGAAAKLDPVLAAQAARKARVLTVNAKRALGYRSIAPEDEAFLQQARALRKNAEGALSAKYGQIFNGMDEAHQTAVGDAFDNLLWQNGKASDLIDPATSLAAGSGSTTADQIARISQRIDKLAQLDPTLDANKLKAAVGEMVPLNQRMWQEGVQNKVFRATDDAPYGKADYLQRHFDFGDMEDFPLEDVQAGIPSTISKTKLGTDQELLNFLQDPDNARAGYERNALKRSLSRAASQGRILERAQVGQKYGPKDFYLANSEHRSAVKDRIGQIAQQDPELGHSLNDMFNGLPGRGNFNRALAFGNSYFKPYAVYGVFVPKLGSIVRNMIGGGFQLAATPEAAKDVGRFVSPKNLADVFGGAVDDGIERLTGSRLGGGSELTGLLKQADNALTAGDGTVEGMLANVQNPTLKSAIENGVLEGFESSEQVGQKLIKSGILGKAPDWLKDWSKMPGDIFKGVEQRMRLGTYKSLVEEHGMAPEKAAAAVRDAYYDYNTWNAPNRAVRDVIPFAAFSLNAARQNAKWIARNPAVGVAASQLFGIPADHPVPQWLSEQASLPFGTDEQGQAQYISGFGLPIESLTKIPGFSGDEIRRDVIGQSQPGLKTAFGWLSGEDPYFGTPFGSYDRTPITGDHSPIGRAYNVLTGAGLNPLDPAISTIDKALDDRRDIPTRALDLLTGANVVSVDEAKAEQEMLQRVLANNPNIKHYDSIYTQSQDPDTRALVQSYNQLRADVKKRHQQEKAQQLAGID